MKVYMGKVVTANQLFTIFAETTVKTNSTKDFHALMKKEGLRFEGGNWTALTDPINTVSPVASTQYSLDLSNAKRREKKRKTRRRYEMV